MIKSLYNIFDRRSIMDKENDEIKNAADTETAEAEDQAANKAEEAAETAEPEAEDKAAEESKAEEASDEAEAEGSAEAEDKTEEAAEATEEKSEEKAEDKEEKAEEKSEEKAEEKSEDKEEKAEDKKEKAAEEKKDKKAAKKAEKKAAAAAGEKKKLSTKGIIGIVAAVVVLAAVIACVIVAKNDGSTYRWLHLSSYVTVGKYKGLTYTKEKVTVTDKEVKSEIESRVKAKETTKSVKTGKVKDGDTIDISYVGKINGKTFDGGSADNYSLTIGSGSMIDGFEDGLIGKKVGSKVTLHLKFPKNYSNNKKLSGKKVTFSVTINSKQVTVTPEYNTDFVKKYSKYDNKKDYEASVKADLKKQKEETNANTVKNTLWSQVVEDSKVKKYPDAQVEHEQETFKKQYKSMAESYGMSWKNFLSSYLGMTSKQFNSQSKTYAKSVVKQKMVLYSIARKENIKVSNSEYKKNLKKILKSSGMSESDFKSQYGMTIEKYAEQYGFRDQMVLEKVTDLIYKEAKATSSSK
jgi:trigger factor